MRRDSFRVEWILIDRRSVPAIGRISPIKFSGHRNSKSIDSRESEYVTCALSFHIRGNHRERLPMLVREKRWFWIASNSKERGRKGKRPKTRRRSVRLDTTRGRQRSDGELPPHLKTRSVLAKTAGPTTTTRERPHGERRMTRRRRRRRRRRRAEPTRTQRRQNGARTAGRRDDGR